MRVGTSRRKTKNEKGKRDHPHACGDKQHRLSERSQKLGSSPCVWGQGLYKHLQNQGSGIIPMRVGTRHVRAERHAVSEDHPHACGDKSSLVRVSSFGGGSSPCVWGQDIWKFCIIGDGRIIPMRVVTSYKNNVADKGTWDHPHACGDKTNKYYTNPMNVGSSPCVWGQA